MELVDNRLTELLSAYDTFILDNDLTLLNSEGEFLPGVVTTLSFLAEQHKQVVIFTNYPKSAAACFTEEAWMPWIKKGFRFFTSGGICQRYLQQQGYFSYFLFGCRPLPGLIFSPDISMAEFIYMDLPGLPLTFLEPEDLIRPAEFPELGFAKDIKPFVKLLQQAKTLNKTIYCGKPSFHETMTLGSQEVISNKVIMDYYRGIGGEVVEIGKPFLPAYEVILRELNNPGKILCVGDTLATDIQGAANLKDAGENVSSLLVLTGETSQDDLHQSYLQPDYIARRFGIVS